MHICQALLGRELKEGQRQRPVWVCRAILSFFRWSSPWHSVHAPRWGGGSHLQGDECRCLLIAISGPRSPGTEYVALIWKKRILNSTCLLSLQQLFFYPTFLTSLTHQRNKKGNTGLQPVSASGSAVLMSCTMKCCQLVLPSAAN